MKILPLDEIDLSGSGQIYRQSRAMALVSTLVYGVVFGGAPFFWRHVGAPWPLWLFFGGIAVIVIPLVVSNLLATFRRTNWIVCVRPTEIVINLRSYQDQSLTEIPTVLVLNDVEIAAARQHTQRYSTPSRNRRSMWHALHSLEIELAHDNSDELASALGAIRRLPQVRKNYLGIGVSTRIVHFPVSLPSANRIRIAWRGGLGNWISPSLAHVLHRLARLTKVADSSHQKNGDWSKVADAELDALIFDLAQSGCKLDAIEILRLRRGYSLTAAHEFVDELIGASLK